MEAHRAHIMRVSLQRLHTRLGLVVPDLDQFVVSARNKVRSVPSAEVLDTVHALLITPSVKLGVG